MNRWSPFFILFVILVSVHGMLKAQIPEHEVPLIRERATAHFRSGNYAQAFPDMRKLSARFPKDPIYRYYTGVCMVELNEDPEAAVELLHDAAMRDVPADVYYYLGVASRRLYRFGEARDYFVQFGKEAPRSQLRERNVRLLIGSALRAMEITRFYNPFEVRDAGFIDLADDSQVEKITAKGGTLSVKPDPFFSAGEERADLNRLMFMPEKPDRGATVYFSGIHGNGKEGFQVMQARRSPTGKWVDIVPVQALNSDGDEILPYFDPVGRDLYFASDGREGLGGFDLYRSHYDEERGEWTEPVNLGFPMNSVEDDYLYLPGEDLGKGMLFSGRMGREGAIAYFDLQVSEPRESLATGTPEEIRQIAQLGMVDMDVVAGNQAIVAAPEPDRHEPEDTGKAAAVNENTTGGETGLQPANEEDPKPEMSLLISRALAHQGVADSLTELSVAMRTRLKAVADANERWKQQQKIMAWERQAEREQDSADRYFAAMGDAPADSHGSSPVAGLPDAIEADTVINGMTVFRYTEKGQQAEEVSGKNEPVYSADQPIPLDESLPGGTFYRIQLGVFSRLVEPEAFNGIYPLSAETIPERNLYKYYAGRFSRYDDAEKALPAVRDAGYTDAFIVAWYNGQVISFDKARKLE